MTGGLLTWELEVYLNGHDECVCEVSIENLSGDEIRELCVKEAKKTLERGDITMADLRVESPDEDILPKALIEDGIDAIAEYVETASGVCHNQESRARGFALLWGDQNKNLDAGHFDECYVGQYESEEDWGYCHIRERLAETAPGADLRWLLKFIDYEKYVSQLEYDGEITCMEDSEGMTHVFYNY